MWTSKNRARYDRSKLRYPSDLTDDNTDVAKLRFSKAFRHMTLAAQCRPEP